MGKRQTAVYDWGIDDQDEFVDVDWFGRVFEAQDQDLAALAGAVNEEVNARVEADTQTAAELNMW
jgi:hypothetical protein